VHSSGSKLSEPEEGDPQHGMGLQEESRVPYALGQSKALFSKFARPFQIPPLDIDHPQCHQYRQELRRLTYLLAKL